MKYYSLAQSLYSIDGFTNDLPRECYKTLGGAEWRKCIGKSNYIRLQRSMLQDDLTSDICIGNDEELRSALYTHIPSYINDVRRLVRPEVLKSANFPADFLEDHQKPKSRMSVAGLYHNTGEYWRKANARKDFKPLSKFALDLFSKHASLMKDKYDEYLKLAPQEQEEVLRSFFIGGTNLGYDLFEKSNKLTITDIVLKKANQTLGTHYKFLDFPCAVSILEGYNNKLIYDPFVLFYRTHKIPKVRSVFGAPIIGKLSAALLSALRVRDDEMNVVVPLIGKFPSVAWWNWDKLFTTIISEMQNNIEKKYVVGEDFSGYDQCIYFHDFDNLLDAKMSNEIKPIIQYELGQMENANVWTSKYKLSDIYFKSGMGGTQLLGSTKHWDLSYEVSQDIGNKINNMCVLSDDNITFFQEYVDLNTYVNSFKQYGFLVNKDKTTAWFLGFVEFLKNWLGELTVEGVATFLGDVDSRYYGLLHSEREAEERDVYKITGSIAIDQLLSKLFSYGTTGIPLIEGILKGIRGTSLGQKAIRAIVALQNGVLDATPYREDLNIGFHPSVVAGKLSVQDV